MRVNPSAIAGAELTKQKLEHLLQEWREKSFTTTCRFFSSPTRWCRRDVDTIGMPTSVIELQKLVDNMTARGATQLSFDDIKTLHLITTMRQYRHSASAQNPNSNASVLFEKIRQSATYQSFNVREVKDSLRDSQMGTISQYIQHELTEMVAKFRDEHGLAEKNVSQIRSAYMYEKNTIARVLRDRYKDTASYQLSHPEQAALVQVALKNKLVAEDKVLLYRSNQPKKMKALFQALGLDEKKQRSLLASFASKQAEAAIPDLRREKNRAIVKQDIATSIERDISMMPLTMRKRQISLMLSGAIAGDVKVSFTEDRCGMVDVSSPHQQVAISFKNENGEDEHFEGRCQDLMTYAEEEFEAQHESARQQSSQFDQETKNQLACLFSKLQQLDEHEEARLWRLQRIEAAARVVKSLKNFTVSHEQKSMAYVSLDEAHIQSVLVWIRGQSVENQDAFIAAFEEAQDRGLERAFFEKLRDAKHGSAFSEFFSGKLSSQQRVAQVIEWAAELWKDPSYPRNNQATLIRLASDDSLVSPCPSSGTPVSIDGSLDEGGELDWSQASKSASPSPVH